MGSGFGLLPIIFKMKNIFYSILITLLFLSPAYAEMKSNVFVTIRLENGVNNPWDGLIFGLAKNATDTMDAEYGEKEIPNFPFPAGVFTAVFLTYNEKEQQDIWSYTCIYGPHPDPDSIRFFKKYRFKVFYGASNYVTMKWGKLPQYLDSAVISDPFGGKFFRVNMKDASEKTNTEYLVDEFDINAYYHVDPNSIQLSDFDNNKFNIYPNPTKDYILFENADSIANLSIYDTNGSKVFSDENYEGVLIDISNYVPGVYLIRINNYEGNSFVKKLIINK
jgi:hypothetical protein